MTDEERMIEYQRNPFDLHDIHVDHHHDHDEGHHEAVMSPIPQEVEQVGVDPAHNIHYVSVDEDHDMRYPNRLGAHHDEHHHDDHYHGDNHYYHGDDHHEDDDNYYGEHGYDHEVVHHELDHPVHDHIHAASDHGNFHNENTYNNHHEDGEHGELYDEHQHTYPTSAHQSTTPLMYNMPQRQLPMFQVKAPHSHPYHSHLAQLGDRRSKPAPVIKKLNTAVLNNGQTIDYGNRVLASYSQQNLNNYLFQTNLEYLTLNGQAKSLGISMQNQ